VAYQKFTEEPPPPPRRKLVAKPVTPPAEPAATTEPGKELEAVPAADGAGKEAAGAAKPAETKPAEAAVAVTPEPKPVEEVKPAVPPPPPQPSVAFRGWVENLKIRGVRGGANPRVFIGASSYQKGDLVNPQMGITFEGYTDATRVLVFKDKSGATVERRN
jgi:hypothetical protein